MITSEQIQEILALKFPKSEIIVTDMTGTKDHYEVRVEWPGFEGKSLIEQHQLVNGALKDRLDDGSIHALSIKTQIAKHAN